jgi:hypothetical protein
VSETTGSETGARFAPLCTRAGKLVAAVPISGDWPSVVIWRGRAFVAWSACGSVRYVEVSALFVGESLQTACAGPGTTRPAPA